MTGPVAADDYVLGIASEIPCVCGVVGVWRMLRDEQGCGLVLECLPCGTMVPIGVAWQRAQEIVRTKSHRKGGPT